MEQHLADINATSNANNSDGKITPSLGNSPVSLQSTNPTVKPIATSLYTQQDVAQQMSTASATSVSNRNVADSKSKYSL